MPLAKADGAYRIAAVGDSFTFGDGVQFQHTWLARLAEVLCAERTGPCDSVNLGIPGYDIEDVVAYLEHKALPYDPDLLLYGFFLNDILPDGVEINGALGRAYRDAYAGPTGLARWSRLADSLHSRAARSRLAQVTRESYAQAFDPDGEAWDTLAHGLRKMARLTRERGINFRVVVFPELTALDDAYPYAAEHQQLHALLDELRIPWIDVFEAWRGREARTLWVHGTDHHPNEIAHDLAARHILARLAEADGPPLTDPQLSEPRRPGTGGMPPRIPGIPPHRDSAGPRGGRRGP